MIQRVLIANRGEIALRILRSLHREGREGVVVYSDADAQSPAVREADATFALGPAPARDSYLRIDRLLEAAAATNCDAVHPGYGFLSENPAFADAVRAAGLTFIGPSSEALRVMGDKDQARTAMVQAGVPVLPGATGEEIAADLSGAAARVGFPLLLKAAAGGGGKGMTHRANQTVIDNFNRVLFQGTLIEVDARKPRSTYEGYSFRYDKMDSDGNVIGTVESQRFKTEAERDKAMSAYNRALPVNAPAKARARRGFSESVEQLRDFDRLKALYNTLPTEVKGAVSRAFDMPVVLGKELQSAIQARLNALLPHPEQKALQDKVYGIVYQKILAGQLIDPYQPLRREGEFWLSYEAVDPELGGTELFKHSFHTEAQRDAAIRMLLAAPADQQIRNIEPYQNVGSAKARARVPMEFVARTTR